jgi:hypothetical protein
LGGIKTRCTEDGLARRYSEFRERRKRRKEDEGRKEKEKGRAGRRREGGKRR